MEDKLRDARCLQWARKLGLKRDALTLGVFNHRGGASFVARELVRFLSGVAKDHEARFLSFDKTVRPFCEAFSVSYDESLQTCITGLCKGGQGVTHQAIDESTSIARCCSSLIARCNATLSVLRASYLCGYAPRSLLDLSRDDIAWANCDSGLQSELEEATRLFVSSGVVEKYCGSQARELFRIDTPRHSVRLMDFVTCHFSCETVLDDVLSLCDAFTHLSHVDACRGLLQKVLLQESMEKKCLSFMEHILLRDSTLAVITLVGVVSFQNKYWTKLRMYPTWKNVQMTNERVCNVEPWKSANMRSN